MNKAVFLDRDGVINHLMEVDGRYESPHTVSDFRFLPGIDQWVSFLKSRGYLIIVVTNQPDVARGSLSERGLAAMHELLSERLAVDDVFFCPHDSSEGCDCRKPRPGMLLRAAEKWNIDLKASFMVGDHERDIDAGRTAGCQTVLVRQPYNEAASADYFLNSYEPLVFKDGKDPFAPDRGEAGR